MSAKLTLGLLVCLLFVDQVQPYDCLNNAVDSIFNFLTDILGGITKVFSGSKDLVKCVGVIKDCNAQADLKKENSCGAARKFGQCVFTTCPDVFGSAEENTIFDSINKIFNEIPDCDLTAEALAAEVNAGHQAVSASFCILSCLLLATAILRQLGAY
ncbi:hypothetical protein RRG08_034536 [Elysia crispata]|uniref:Uncharacterized protein n=1 Tax=Elysia crispata TaxID=231223 RepID=A0AAE1BBW8_9GAST|nr:hypothetical protein RRG08_034536 [Elysia crispata]